MGSNQPEQALTTSSLFAPANAILNVNPSLQVAKLLVLMLYYLKMVSFLQTRGKSLAM